MARRTFVRRLSVGLETAHNVFGNFVSHKAFRTGDVGIVQNVRSDDDFMSAGAPIDAQDPYGNTVLHTACQNGNKRLVKACLRFVARFVSASLMFIAIDAMYSHFSVGKACLRCISCSLCRHLAIKISFSLCRHSTSIPRRLCVHT